MDDLLKVAVAGTARSGGGFVLLASPIDRAVVQLDAHGTERRLLLTAGAHAVRQRAGALPLAHGDAPDAAGDEAWDVAPPRVALLLGELLSGRATDVLPEAFERLRHARLLVPPAMLPAALDAGKHSKATRSALLATDRAPLLYGLPGTAKSWVSEHLAAAISGDSTMLVQGMVRTDENTIRYGWNYARLIAEGPSRDALVTSPVMRAMEDGKIARVEELTRIPSETQDTLITILSEKTLPVPELGTEVQARKGFNLIGTANNRDRGVNELSSALMRRFNTVVLPTPATIEEEVEIGLDPVQWTPAS